MKLKKINDPFEIIAIAIIVLDILSVLISPMHILRGIVWFLFVPILMLFNPYGVKDFQIYFCLSMNCFYLLVM